MWPRSPFPTASEVTEILVPPRPHAKFSGDAVPGDPFDEIAAENGLAAPGDEIEVRVIAEHVQSVPVVTAA